MADESRPSAASPNSSTETVGNQVAQRLVLRDPFQDYWSNVVLWVSIAEALLPFCLLVLVALYNLLAGTPRADGLGHLLITAVMSLCLGFTLVFATILIVTGILSALIGFACKTLGINVSNTRVGAFTGGCVGLLMALPFAGSGIPSLLFLFVSTLLGQLGGGYGAWKTYHRPRNSSEQPLKVRFGIKQLLILTVWFSILMTILKLAGMITESYLTFFGSWFALQGLGIVAVRFWETSARPAV